MSGYCAKGDWKRLGETSEEAFTVLAYKYEDRIQQIDELYAEIKRLKRAAAADRPRIEALEAFWKAYKRSVESDLDEVYDALIETFDRLAALDKEAGE